MHRSIQVQVSYSAKCLQGKLWQSSIRSLKFSHPNIFTALKCNGTLTKFAKVFLFKNQCKVILPQGFTYQCFTLYGMHMHGTKTCTVITELTRHITLSCGCIYVLQATFGSDSCVCYIRMLQMHNMHTYVCTIFCTAGSESYVRILRNQQYL